MNVGIIFYASRETGDRLLRDVALRHSLTTRRVLVRGDGSTAHEEFSIWRPASFCGRRPNRGIAAIRAGHAAWHGAFTVSAPCYEYSRDPRFLDHGGGLRGLLHHSHAGGWRGPLGFQCAGR